MTGSVVLVFRDGFPKLSENGRECDTGMESGGKE